MEHTQLHSCPPELLSKIREDTLAVISELLNKLDLEKGSIFVVGCSSSEMTGGLIGHYSSLEAAEAAFEIISKEVSCRGLYLAAQCCEHLNRAIVIEKELAERERLDIVRVIPQPKAGGSFATLTYRSMEHPVVVEHIRADAGLDIGGTLIGMQLKEVAVPVRLSQMTIGNAHINCAYTRPKYIGGARAVYEEV